MRRPLFLPTARQTNWLLAIAFLAVGEALYLRYMAIENVNVSLACQAGLKTWLCGTFRLTIILFDHEVFGAVALVAALLNLLRPSIVLSALALAAAAFRRRAAQRRLVGACGRRAHPQPGASRARTRMTARPISRRTTIAPASWRAFR